MFLSFFFVFHALCGIPELSGHRYNASIHTSTRTIMSSRYADSYTLDFRGLVCACSPVLTPRGGKTEMTANGVRPHVLVHSIPSPCVRQPSRDTSGGIGGCVRGRL